MLSGPEIVRQVEAGKIAISAFDASCVGPNSYDLRLDSRLLVYEAAARRHDWLAQRRFRWWNPLSWSPPSVRALDPRVEEPVVEYVIPDAGMTLYPGVLYLGSTVEHTSTTCFVPWIDGRSSIGRLGLGVHVTAGLGDAGFSGTWTLEITVVQPVVVFPQMKVCQICFDELSGDYKPYDGRYRDQNGPVSSRYHRA